MDKEEKAALAPPEVLQRETVTKLDTQSSLCVAPLAELLERFHQHSATDVRDKIYALLGLSSDLQNTSVMQADYTKSWSALLEDVIKHYLGHTANITT